MQNPEMTKYRYTVPVQTLEYFFEGDPSEMTEAEYEASRWFDAEVTKQHREAGATTAWSLPDEPELRSVKAHDLYKYGIPEANCRAVDLLVFTYQDAD